MSTKPDRQAFIYLYMRPNYTIVRCTIIVHHELSIIDTITTRAPYLTGDANVPPRRVKNWDFVEIETVINIT